MQTRRLLDSLVAHGLTDVFIFVDGSNSGDLVAMKSQTEVIALLDDFQGKLQIKLHPNRQRLGLKNAAVKAISWFFRHRDFGIIIEDDCLPTAGFVEFVSENLEFCRQSPHISQINGSNHATGAPKNTG